MNLALYILGQLPPPPHIGAGRMAGPGFPPEDEERETRRQCQVEASRRRANKVTCEYRAAMAGRGKLSSAAIASASGRSQNGVVAMMAKLAARGLVKIHVINARENRYEWVGGPDE